MERRTYIVPTKTFVSRQFPKPSLDAIELRFSEINDDASFDVIFTYRHSIPRSFLRTESQRLHIVEGPVRAWYRHWMRMSNLLKKRTDHRPALDASLLVFVWLEVSSVLISFILSSNNILLYFWADHGECRLVVSLDIESIHRVSHLYRIKEKSEEKDSAVGHTKKWVPASSWSLQKEVHQNLWAVSFSAPTFQPWNSPKS